PDQLSLCFSNQSSFPRHWSGRATRRVRRVWAPAVCASRRARAARCCTPAPWPRVGGMVFRLMVLGGAFFAPFLPSTPPGAVEAVAAFALRVLFRLAQLDHLQRRAKDLDLPRGVWKDLVVES